MLPPPEVPVPCGVPTGQLVLRNEVFHRVFVVDKPFIDDVQVTCEKEGMPSLRRVVVPHPCGDIPDEQYATIIPKLIEGLTVPFSEEGEISKEESRLNLKGSPSKVTWKNPTDFSTIDNGPTACR